MLDWIFGEEIIFTIPDSVEVLELGYRESGYNSAITTKFECDLQEVNTLFKKCVRTLKICMREKCERMQINENHMAACWMNVRDAMSAETAQSEAAQETVQGAEQSEAE